MLSQQLAELAAGKSPLCVQIQQQEHCASQNEGVSAVESPHFQCFLQPFPLQLVPLQIVQSLVIGKVPRAEDGQPNREGLGVFRGGVDGFSALEFVEVFGGEVGECFVEGFLDVGVLKRPREGVGHFDASLFVEEDVLGPDVAQSLPRCRRLPLSLGNAEEQAPQLCLCEVGLEALSVVDFFAEQVGVVVVGELCGKRITMRVPVFPQSPLREKLCSMGRSKFSGTALYFLSACFHLSYSFWSMACEVWSCFSALWVRMVDLRKRGWLISMWNSLACSLSLLPINKYNKIINRTLLLDYQK